MLARRLVGPLALASAVILGATGTAHAETPFPRVYTVAEGGLGCAGWIDARVIPGPHPWVVAGEARVLFTGTFYGIGLAITPVHDCAVGIYADWRNLDTGLTGRTIWGGARGTNGIPSSEGGVTIFSGPGRVTATLHTNALHVPSTVEFTVGGPPTVTPYASTPNTTHK